MLNRRCSWVDGSKNDVVPLEVDMEKIRMMMWLVTLCQVSHHNHTDHWRRSYWRYAEGDGGGRVGRSHRSLRKVVRVVALLPRSQTWF